MWLILVLFPLCSFANENTGPIAIAGKDRVVYLPFNRITLTGSYSDDGVITSRKWELISGSATLTSAGADSLVTLSNLSEGVYLLRYSVTDNQGLTGSDEVKVTATHIAVLPALATDPARVKVTGFANGSTLTTQDGDRLRGFWQAGYKDPLDEFFNNAAFNKNLRNMGFNAVKVWWDNTNIGGSYTDVNDSTEVAVSLSYMDSIVNLASVYGLQIMIEGGNISYYQNPSTEVLNFRKENLEQWWSILARRYKDRTHVFYEMQNEPFYINPYGYPVVQDIKKWYQVMRSQAPDTHIVLFAFMISCGNMLNLADDLNAQTTIDWTKASISYHGYGDCQPTEIQALRAKYPVIETEFWPEKGLGETLWPTTDRANFYEIEGLEKEEISWFAWTTHNSTRYDVFLPPILADLKARGVMWNFSPVDFREPVIAVRDTTIFEPANSVTINAIVSSPVRSIVKYQWVLRKTTGDAVLTPNGPSITLSAMKNGIYWLRLHAWDDAGYYSCKDIQVVLTKLHQIPGKIEAEDFSAMFNIGTEQCFDEGGGLNTGWMAISSWMDYVVNIDQDGMYLIELRVAGDTGAGGKGKLLIDGAQISPVFEAPETGGWQIFKSVYTNTVLPKGRHTLRFTTIKSGYNLNWMNFTKTAATIQVSPDQSINLPTNSIDLVVKATDPSGIKSYRWKVLEGKNTVVLSNADTDTLKVTKLELGEYLLNVTALTNNEIPYNANVKVSVSPCSDIVKANAGADIKIQLPVDSLEITATAEASSGIASYRWRQTTGVASTLTNTNTNKLKISKLKTGIYRYEIAATSNAGCMGYDEIKVSVFAASGIETEKEPDLSVNVYPNPTNGTVTIERSDWTDQHTTVKMSDISGKILKLCEWRDDKMEWSVEQYPKGLYIISIQFNGGVVYKKLMIE
jgi:hypothetical protein